ncbi:uncharacterized protein BX663DRAFT_488564 [Cokeromyces recurvatus]|uniref:uncharacterized protein n=1 Tax=Cokeromyces recurvatus TaxID=90255 RepID=UPI0022207429|nr:uncharacterized protein BX663DRAFT_488564 [Cokeromyces recurvatus]KAI7900368.1 hypothetical protein BX663DRAFT_488564 [Cokeromyces recurvatus]
MQVASIAVLVFLMNFLNTTFFDGKNRTVYKCHIRDAYINNYNPYLLKMTKFAMDIQVNSGKDVLYYLAKYLSKVDSGVNLQFNMENMHDHMKDRIVSVVDAAYFLCDWNKHRCSRSVVYICTVLSGRDERRQIRRDLDRLDVADTNIYTNTHVQKYLNRHHQLGSLTMPEYFTLYKTAKEHDTSDELNVDACTDAFGIRYEARSQSRKLPFWRTHEYSQSDQEAFFYQRLLFYKPIPNEDMLDILKQNNNDSWRDVFFDICEDNDFQITEQELEKIKRIDHSMMMNRATSNFGDNRNEEEYIELLERMLEMANVDQRSIYELISNSLGIDVVYGAAGTGKSFLLRLLYYRFRTMGYNPVVLAPTGIAACTAGGQTIDRFFGSTMHYDGYNPVRIEDYMKSHLK